MINNLIIKEGQKTVGIALLLTVISALFICSFLTTLLAIITVVLIYIYRNSKEKSVEGDFIVSPCDGVVTAIDRVGEKQVLFVKVGLCDSHTLRAPISAKMKLSQVRYGLNLDVDTYKAKKLNNLFVVKFDKVKVSLLSSRFNLTTVIDEPKMYHQNDRFGVFINGEVKITLPKKKKTTIKIGQKVCAGKTILA